MMAGPSYDRRRTTMRLTALTAVITAAFVALGVQSLLHVPRPHAHEQHGGRSLAAIARGGQTGIALSHCAVGDGVNAPNIKRCLTLLHEAGFTGHLSIECEGQGGPLLTQSLNWLRDT